MIELSTRCHHCGQHLALEDGHHGFVVHCPDCIDPDGESSTERLQGRGATPDDALQNWFDRREELGLEPESTLSALASFIVPKSPEGWVFRCTRLHSSMVDIHHTLPDAENDYCDAAIYYEPFVGQKAANDS